MKKNVAAWMTLLLLAAAPAILLLDLGSSQAQGPAPADLVAAAEAKIRTGINDPETRTEAVWLYEDALDLVKGDDAASRSIKARAHLGLAVINLIDFFDLLPALSNFLGIDILDLFNPSAAAAMTMAGAGGPVRPAAACTAVDFEDYLFFLDRMLTNMLMPTIDHARLARELDPGVTLVVETGMAVLVPDNPATPEDDSMVLDLAGEWDATDAALFQGGLEVLLGGLKLLLSYDGILQSMINPTLSPACQPVPGSDDWTDTFGPYNLIVPDGGEQRMIAAGALMAAGFQAFHEGLELLAAETDDQSDDLVRYYDYGSDGLGPADPGYPGPDADGTEANGAYDPGEPWGMDSIGVLLDSLLGSLLSGLPFNLSDLSRMLPPPALAALVESMGQSAESGTPVDLVPTLLKPLLPALGLGGTDQQLYALGLPALNLGALFLPPLADLSVISPLTDAAGTPITEPEAADVSHTWPDGSGRVDPPNGTVDAAYSFYQDQDAEGNDVGVMGGLVLTPVTTPADFDAEGNLIGAVEFDPMMNPQFNSLMGLLGALLP
ncbi:MAG TPA: hypothetical protein VM658_13240 [bacterium]|nr:hypothetical protein [bacterium]